MATGTEKAAISAGERISNVAQQWFLHEPLLFSVYCTHEITENKDLRVPMRSGKGRIEYNEEMLGNMNDRELTGCLRVETLRILLKHPYIRQPFRARPEILFLASNMTIRNNIEGLKELDFELVPLNIVARLPQGKTFEEYYGLLNRMFPPSDNSTEDKGTEEGNNEDENSSGAGGQNSRDDSSSEKESSSEADGQNSQDSSSDKQNQSNQEPLKPGNQTEHGIKKILKDCAEAAATWQEDSISADNINILIERALNGPKGIWGTIKGNFIELVEASLVPPVDVANLLKRFKKTILSQRRDLTRMRPSRRYGFEQMGSKYAYTTGVLVAIDTSGSVDSDMLTRMLGLVNRIFKQGVERIDVIQFDTDIQGKSMPIKKCIKKIEISGRGGTDFQPAANYYMDHPEYDGLIYITDGEAEQPRIPRNCGHLPVTWIITDDDLIPTIQHGWDREGYW